MGPFISVAQTNTVTVQAHLKGLVPGLWVYCWETGKIGTLDSVPSEAGGFVFHLSIPEGEGDEYVLSFDNDQPGASIAIYLDRDTVNITGDGPDFRDAVFTGALHNIEYRSFMDYQKRNVDTISPQNYNLKTTFKIDSEWVVQHPSSPISPLVLRTFTHFAPEEELDQMVHRLSSSALNSVCGKEMAYSAYARKILVEGKPALDFTQNDTAGRPVSLKDFRGRYVLLEFWACFCELCRTEHPYLIKAYQAFKDKGFTIISVSLDPPGGRDRWLETIHEDGLYWTNVSDLKFWQNAIGMEYGIIHLPANFLIDPQGNILAKNLKGEDLQKKLEEILH